MTDPGDRWRGLWLPDLGPEVAGFFACDSRRDICTPPSSQLAAECGRQKSASRSPTSGSLARFRAPSYVSFDMGRKTGLVDFGSGDCEPRPPLPSTPPPLPIARPRKRWATLVLGLALPSFTRDGTNGANVNWVVVLRLGTWSLSSSECFLLGVETGEAMVADGGNCRSDEGGCWMVRVGPARA